MARLFLVMMGICFLALPAVANSASSADGTFPPSAATEAVTINTSEPRPADPYKLTISGNCEGMPVSVRFQRDSHGGHAGLIVSIGGAHTAYGPDEPFVHDLFLDRVAYGFGITCGSMGKREGMDLWANGFSSRPGASPQGGNAQVIFGPGGKLVKYFGLSPNNDPLR